MLPLHRGCLLWCVDETLLTLQGDISWPGYVKFCITGVLTINLSLHPSRTADMSLSMQSAAPHYVYFDYLVAEALERRLRDSPHDGLLSASDF